jgi:hypothetical protein
MADFHKPLDFRRSDSRGWAGEPDLVPVYALAACLIAGALVFLIGAVAHL